MDKKPFLGQSEVTGPVRAGSVHVGTMSIGIDFEDLGIEPDYSGPENVEEIPTPQGRNLVAGSTLAKTLSSVWDGAPVTIVDSPPCAGKTTLVVDIVAYLRERFALKSSSRATPSVSRSTFPRAWPLSSARTRTATRRSPWASPTPSRPGVSKGEAHTGGEAQRKESAARR